VAHDASAATDYLLTLERDRSRADEALAAGPTLDSPGSGTASLEEQTQKLECDREDELETESALDADRATDSPAAAVPVRESSNDIARWDPGGGTLQVEDKQTGTLQHSPIGIHSANGTHNGKGG
jgi:hypothetical protein